MRRCGIEDLVLGQPTPTTSASASVQRQLCGKVTYSRFRPVAVIRNQMCKRLSVAANRVLQTLQTGSDPKKSASVLKPRRRPRLRRSVLSVQRPSLRRFRSSIQHQHAAGGDEGAQRHGTQCDPPGH